MARNDLDGKTLEQMIEFKLKKVLKDKSPPDREVLAALNTAIKFVAVQHKISEGDWGSEFSNYDEEGTDGSQSGRESTDTDGHADPGREPGTEDT